MELYLFTFARKFAETNPCLRLTRQGVKTHANTKAAFTFASTNGVHKAVLCLPFAKRESTPPNPKNSSGRSLLKFSTFQQTPSSCIVAASVIHLPPFEHLTVLTPQLLTIRPSKSSQEARSVRFIRKVRAEARELDQLQPPLCSWCARQKHIASLSQALSSISCSYIASLRATQSVMQSGRSQGTASSQWLVINSKVHSNFIQQGRATDRLTF